LAEDATRVAAVAASLRVSGDGVISAPPSRGSDAGGDGGLNYFGASDGFASGGGHGGGAIGAPGRIGGALSFTHAASPAPLAASIALSERSGTSDDIDEASGGTPPPRPISQVVAVVAPPGMPDAMSNERFAAAVAAAAPSPSPSPSPPRDSTVPHKRAVQSSASATTTPVMRRGGSAARNSGPALPPSAHASGGGGGGGGGGAAASAIASVTAGALALSVISYATPSSDAATLQQQTTTATTTTTTSTTPNSSASGSVRTPVRERSAGVRLALRAPRVVAPKEDE
jgi:hypothetical protein